MNPKLLMLLLAAFVMAFSVACECTSCRFPRNAQVIITYTNADGTITRVRATTDSNGCVRYNCDGATPDIRPTPILM